MDWLQQLEDRIDSRQQVHVIERHVGGYHYRLQLCAEGFALHEAWDAAVAEARTRGSKPYANQACTQTAKAIKAASRAYWDHRRRGNDGKPCQICKMVEG